MSGGLVIGLVLASGLAVAAAVTTAPDVGMRSGLWELRVRGETGTQRLCVRDSNSLIQLRHPGRVCDQIVLERTSRALVVQYTCKGNGFGRTELRRETAQLAQVQTQGIADGLPFDFSAEARWMGECGRTAG